MGLKLFPSYFFFIIFWGVIYVSPIERMLYNYSINPLSKDIMCHVWLKLLHENWFIRRIMLMLAKTPILHVYCQKKFDHKKNSGHSTES